MTLYATMNVERNVTARRMVIRLLLPYMAYIRMVMVTLRFFH